MATTFQSDTPYMPVTAGYLVDEILRELRILGKTQTADSDRFQRVLRKYNMWISLHGTYGNIEQDTTMMWKITNATHAIASQKAAYTFGEQGGEDYDVEPYTDIQTVMIKDAYGNDQELEHMTRKEYDMLYDKDAEGVPTKYYYEKSKLQGTLYLDYEPETTYSFVITGKKQITKLTAATDEIDLDEHWLLASILDVAVICGPSFGLADSNPAFARTVANAQMAMAMVNTQYPSGETFDLYPMV